MKKVVGYVISGVGLAIMILGIGNFKFGIEVLDTIGETYIIGVGVVMVIAGVVLSMMDSRRTGNVEHAGAEVPIYEGVGKKRRIVGYRRG